MKRTIFFLLMLMVSCGRIALAQESPPPSQYLKSVNAQFYLDSRDSSVWHFKGTQYGWERLGRYKDVAAKLNISDTTTLLRKSTATMLYAKLVGGNALTGNQNVTGNITATGTIQSGFINPGFIDGTKIFAGNGNFSELNDSGNFKLYTGNKLKLFSSHDGQVGTVREIKFLGDTIQRSSDNARVAWTTDLTSGYVPYTGWLNDVNGGLHNLILGGLVTADSFSTLNNGGGITTVSSGGITHYGDGITIDAAIDQNFGRYQYPTYLNFQAKDFSNTFINTVHFGSPVDDQTNWFKYNTIVGGTLSSNITGARLHVEGNSYTTGNATANVFKTADGYGQFTNSVLSVKGGYIDGQSATELYLQGYDVTHITTSNPAVPLQPLLMSFNLRDGPTAYNRSYVGFRVDVAPSSANDVVRLTDIASRPDSSTIANTYVKKAGDTMTGDLILPNTTPTNSLQAVNKSYVDNLLYGLAWKNAARAKTTGNITLSGTQTIDGVSLSVGNRVLVNLQTDPTQNGIYIVASGAWTRASDADTGDELLSATIVVTAGTANKNTQWTCSNTTSPTMGSDNITFVQTAGAGVYTNGSGLDLAANVFSVNTSYVRGLFSATSPLSYNSSTGAFTIQQSSSSQGGYLSSTDWTTFNGKQATGNYITALTGEVTASGPGSVTATINKAITPVWIGLHTHRFNGIGNTVTDAILLQNTDAAANNAQQYSPAIHFSSNGWGTTAGTSQAVDWQMFSQPFQSTTAGGFLNIQRSLNGAAYTNVFSLSDGGNLTVPGIFRTTISGFGTVGQNGVRLTNISTATVSVPVQYSPRLLLSGAAWNTSTGISNTIEWINEVRPISGTTTSGDYVWASSNNGGSYSDLMSLSSGGALTTSGGLTVSSGSSSLSGANLFIFSSNTGSGTSSYALFGGASNFSARMILGNNTGGAITGNSVYSNTIIGASPLTVPTGTTSPWVNSLTVKAPNVTLAGTGAVTSSATIYAENPTIGSNLYGVYSLGAIKSTGRQLAVTALKTTNYSTTVNDEIIPCNSTAGGFNVTLLSTAPIGTIYTIDNTDGTANSVTVVGTINGVTNYTLNANQSITVWKTAAGSNTWKISAKN